MIQTGINLCDLIIFYYYLKIFRKMKKVSKKWYRLIIVILAVVWAWVNTLEYPFLNLITLTLSLCVITGLFEGNNRSNIIIIVIYISAGILVEPLGLIFFHIINYDLNSAPQYIYYVVAGFGVFIRGIVVYCVCKKQLIRKVHLSKLPKEIVCVLMFIFGFSVLNCCFSIILLKEFKEDKSLIMCISIIITTLLIFCFVVYMMDRINYFLNKQHEDELYRSEMHYKEIYYSEIEKRNEEVHNLKHDLKNKLTGLLYLVEKQDMEHLSEQIGYIFEELEKIDAKSYTKNQVVDSVLRVKMGIAKAQGIRTDVIIRIPEKLHLEYGDIGVLYGNLLDNAIEACMQIPEEDRYIRVENKFVEGNMLLLIQNTKKPIRNEKLLTTKEDTYSHGRGIRSVRRVVEKYNGTIFFMDRVESFEVSVMIYGAEEEIEKRWEEKSKVKNEIKK